MKNTPIYAAVIGEQTILDITNFRYGQQIGETRVFEFRFKPQHFGTPFSFGFDDAKNYNNQLITLMVSGPLGKGVELPGTITKVDYVQSPGYEAEVIISGTVYSPSGNTSKFIMFLAGVLLIPLLLGGYFMLRVNNLKHGLVDKTGIIETFKQHGAKGSRVYTIKLKEYPAVFYRMYMSTPGHLGWPDVKAIMGYNFDDFDKDNTVHTVEFYVLSSDESKLGDTNARLLFFNPRAKGQHQSGNVLFYDLLEYVVNRWDAFVIRMLSLFLGLGCWFGAYSYYRMLAPDYHLKYAIPYWGCVGLSVLIYFLMVIF